jgi:hypothetical protein
MLQYLAKAKGFHYFFNIQPLTLADRENTALDIYSMDPSKIGVRHQTEGENQNWPKK